MMNHDIDETGLEYEEQQNALEQEAWADYHGSDVDLHDVQYEDGNNMYPDDVEHDEYPW